MSLADNLVAYWKLDELSGTRVDATGRGNDLTDNNTVAGVAGLLGNGADIVRANNEYLSCLDSADVSLGGTSFYIDCFFKYRTPGDNTLFHLLTKSTSTLSAANNEYYLRLSFTALTNTLTGRISNGTAQSGVATGASVSNNATPFHHFGMRYDLAAGELQLFRNGVLDGSAVSFAGGAWDSNKTFQIGAINGAQGIADGIFDEVGVWKYAPTDAEILARYNSGVGTTFPFAAARPWFFNRHVLSRGRAA